MSHFTVLVGMTEEQYNNDMSETLDRILHPFDENIEVEPYQRECHCVGWQAKTQARERARKELSWNWEEKRAVFHEMYKDKSWEESDKLWKEFIQPYNDLEEYILNNHPGKNEPDEDCEECHGTGTYESTYNPQSKWDWYQVGGRWDNDLVEFKEIPDGNVAYGHELANNYVSFAIALYHDGKHRWAERGKMGWWAHVSNENDNWEAIASELLTQFKDRVFVLVDCHI